MNTMLALVYATTFNDNNGQTQTVHVDGTTEYYGLIILLIRHWFILLYNVMDKHERIISEHPLTYFMARGF